MNVGSFFSLTFIVNFQPFENSFQNYMELFNEAMILLLSYFCWTFCDYNSDSELKYELGWGYNFVICLAVVVNVGSIVTTEVIIKIQRLIRKKSAK
jgi:hypothetical protein